MPEVDFNEDIGILAKSNTVIGKAVDYFLKKVTLGEDPMDYDENILDEKGKIKKADQLRNESKKYYASENYASAIDYMKIVRKLQPGSNYDTFDLLYYMCSYPNIYIEILPLSSHLNLDAIDDFRKVEVLSVISYLQGSIDEAYNLLKYNIEKEELFNSFGGNYITGIVIEEEKPEIAAKYFRRAVQLYPDDVDTHLRLMKCYENVGDLVAIGIEKDILQILS